MTRAASRFIFELPEWLVIPALSGSETETESMLMKPIYQRGRRGMFIVLLVTMHI